MITYFTEIQGHFIWFRHKHHTQKPRFKAQKFKTRLRSGDTIAAKKLALRRLFVVKWHPGRILDGWTGNISFQVLLITGSMVEPQMVEPNLTFHFRFFHGYRGHTATFFKRYSVDAWIPVFELPTEFG